MFQSAYQDGDSVDVFSPTGKNPAADWKLTGKVGRLYDKSIKGYVLAVSGGVTSKMQIPKAPKGTLGLRQRHLVVQLLTAASQDMPFSLELGVTDAGGTRRRLVISSSFRALHCTPLHAQIPLLGLDNHRGSWANLSVDLAGLMSICFRADAFRTLDLLAIGPTCRVRKIFTTKGAIGQQYAEEEDDGVVSDRGENGGIDPAPIQQLPLRMSFPAGVKPPPRTWIISASTLRAFANCDRPGNRLKDSVARVNSRREVGTRSVASPTPSALQHRRSTLSSSQLLSVARVERSALSSRGKETPSPRRRRASTATPNQAQTVSPPSRATSSRVMSANSVYHAAMPSPLATPASINSGTSRRHVRTPLSSTRPTSSMSGGSVSGGSRGSGGGGVVLSTGRKAAAVVAAAAASTTPRRLAHRLSSPSVLPHREEALATFDRSSDAAATTLGVVTGNGSDHNTVRHGLPARRRACEAAAVAAAIDDDDNSRRTTGRRALLSSGSCRERGMKTQARQQESLDGWEAVASGQNLGAVGSWGGAPGSPAPAWSFSDGGDDALVEEPRSKLTLSATGTRLGGVASPAIKGVDVPGEFRLDSATTPNTNTRVARLDVDRYRPLSRPHPLPWQLEANTTDDKVYLREETGGRGGPAGPVAPLRSARRSSDDTPSARSPASPVSALNDVAMTRSADSEHRLARSTQVTADPAAAFDKNSPSPTPVSRRKEDRDVFTTEPTESDLFTPPISVPRGDPACRPSPANGAIGLKSPVSNRIDVLQALLAPADKAKGSRGEEDIARSMTKSVAAVKARVGSGGGGSCAEVDDNSVDALEHFLDANTVNTAVTTTSMDEVPVDPNMAAAAGGGHDDQRTVDRHTTHWQGFNFNIGNSSSDDVRTDQPRDNHCHQALSNPSPRTQTPESSSACRTSMVSIECERCPGIGARPTDLDEATAAQPNNCGAGSEAPDNVSFASEVLGKGVQQRTFRDRPAVGEGWENETGSMGLMQGTEASRDQHKMEELQRKELALVDLEDSYHMEFGSVHFSQSPEARASFVGDSSPGFEKNAADGSTSPTTNCDKIGSVGTTDISPQQHRQRSVCDNIDENDQNVDDADQHSVALGSAREHGQKERLLFGGGNHIVDSHDDDVLRDAVDYAERPKPWPDAAAVTPTAELSADLPITINSDNEEIRSLARLSSRGGRGGVVGGVAKNSRDGETSAHTKDGELFFDPVLNCYYDKATDKYYGLR